ncbi:MAG: hypothetical protein GY695_14980 [Aestuariibacter sp.]|uniref:hypothetical protein n=1 Tax=Marisediminitalea aggregata TaxID=634436 RepID=UPI000C5E2B6B|nr:hypothetical protein [Marisediminitalea aggregata]MBL52273.1 hypothetical protein [Alteromonadaceae bacterium]MCP3864417.1 hypothetical protein [Aestuariibacter sp.]MCP4527576.1 hypothetical protein [Aestuariibacter sp.]MCP9478874.1 hypothetical protein [Marisediminitalea aggregata]|tara:strand:+ start:13531 stop:13902 length:372 start_codon:yes stop_codon:yes gene_type:complete
MRMIQNEKDFIEWLDRQLNVDIPSDVIAFNINIYESPFNVELVGSSEFDPENEDWACNEDWVSEPRMESVSAELFGSSWEEAQENIFAMAKAYLSSGVTNAKKLNSAKAFAVGFVDGSLRYVH